VGDAVLDAVAGYGDQVAVVVTLGVSVWFSMFVVDRAVWLIKSHVWYPYQESRGKYD
jgi:hypothetical protein